MALREVLAELDARVTGAADVRAVTDAVDRFAAGAYAAATPLERLRLKQQAAQRVVHRLTTEIRRLSRAEGDHALEIHRLEIARVRATNATRDYGREADRLAGSNFQATRGISGLVANVRAAGPVLVAATAGLYAAVRGVRAVASELEEVIALGDNLDKTSQRIGTTARALQEWRFIGEHAGLTAEQMDHALETFNRTTGQAAQGTGEAVQSYRRLGIQLRDTNGELRSSDDVFRDVRQALARIENPMERAATASRIFGESASQLNPILNMTEEELVAARARFAELGGGLGDDLVENAAAAEDAMGDFRLAMTSLRGVLAANVLPVLTRTIAGLASFVGRGLEVIRTSSTMQTVLGGLAIAAGALAIAMLPMVLTTLAVIAPFVALFLVAEDLNTAFRGGESAIGSWVEQALEAMGITTTFGGVVDHLGLAWDMAAAKAREALADILEAAEGVQRALGIGDLDAAESRTTDARRAAIAARRRVGETQGKIDTREQQRIAARQRATEGPAPPVVESAAGRRRGGGARGAASPTTIHSPITIHGAQDPQAVRREVERALEDRNREVADTLALAEPELA